MESKDRFFKAEWHYFSAASIVVCGCVLFMHFGFRYGWANSSFAIAAVDVMRRFIPAIRRLHDGSSEYTNYWGVFFSVFWITAPIYWVLGFGGGGWLSACRYRKLIIETTIARIVCVLLMCSLGLGFAFTFPILSGMYLVRETSHFFPLLVLSWWTVSAIIYYQAQACRILIIKLLRK